MASGKPCGYRENTSSGFQDLSCTPKRVPEGDVYKVYSSPGNVLSALADWYSSRNILFGEMVLSDIERLLVNNYLEAVVDRFLVISPHTQEDCKKAIAEVLATGYITHFEWGCMDGEHTGWAILEAENAKQAQMAVPPAQRHSASIIRLTKFSPAEIEKMHVA